METSIGRSTAAHADFEADWSNWIAPHRGVYRGRERARELFEAFLEAWEEFQRDPQELVEVDESRVLRGSSRVRGARCGQRRGSGRQLALSCGRSSCWPGPRREALPVEGRGPRGCWEVAVIFMTTLEATRPPLTDTPSSETSACTRSRPGEGPPWCCSTGFPSSGAGGAARFRRWPLPGSGSSRRTCAATTCRRARPALPPTTPIGWRPTSAT